MRILTLTLLIGTLLVTAPLDAARGQILGPMQANWRDLETWTQVDQGSRENELGLGLQPIGGAVIAFLGRLSTRDPNRPPSELRVHVAPGYVANSNVLRVPTLVFMADPGTEQRTVIDVSARLVADDVASAGTIQNAVGPMRASDFLRLTRAERLTANILGFDVTFRPDQIRAMRDFADRLHLK